MEEAPGQLVLQHQNKSDVAGLEEGGTLASGEESTRALGLVVEQNIGLLRMEADREPVLLSAAEVLLSELRLENIWVLLIGNTSALLLLLNIVAQEDIWVMMRSACRPDVHDDEQGSWWTQSEVWSWS